MNAREPWASFHVYSCRFERFKLASVEVVMAREMKACRKRPGGGKKGVLGKKKSGRAREMKNVDTNGTNGIYQLNGTG